MKSKIEVSPRSCEYSSEPAYKVDTSKTLNLIFDFLNTLKRSGKIDKKTLKLSDNKYIFDIEVLK